MVVVLAGASLAGAFVSLGVLPTGVLGSLGGPPAAGSAPVVSPASSSPPALTVSPTSGPVGTTITFSATGFPHGAALNISDSYWHKNVCPGEKTTSTGTFSCTYTLVPTPGGPASPLTYTMVAGADSAVATFTVEPQLLPSPSSGLVGTTISFLGTGFGGELEFNKTGGRIPVQYPVAVNWTLPGGQVYQVCTGATDASDNGSFACNNTYVLPNVDNGPHTFYATESTPPLSATASFSVEAGLSEGPSFGPANTAVTFSGTGWPAAAVVYVNWTVGGLTVAACSATSLNVGTFSCGYTIPYGTLGGEYQFVASVGKVSAVSPFYLTSLAVSPVSATVGSTVNFTGAGFPSNAALSLSWSGGPVSSCLNTTGAGTFRCAFIVPPTTAGSYVFNASSGPDYATVGLTVQPSLELNRSYGEPGTPVRFTGAGFGASLPVSVSWSPNGTPMTACSSTTSSAGAFSCTFSLPSWAAGGPHTFTAVDQNDNSASTGFTVTFLSLSPSSGPNATSVSATGGGFAPSSSVTWSWGGLNFGCTSLTTSSLGAFSCSFVTKNAPTGTYVYTAKDASGDEASAPFTITPALFASPVPKGLTVARGPVGTKIHFALSGFPSSSSVTVTWSNGTTVCSNTTSSTGQTNCTYTLPSTPAGTYTFVASGPSATVATASFQVVPSLAVTPTTGYAGTVATFAGLGFGAKSVLNVTSSLGVACLQVVTNSTGGFGCTYTIPPAPSGAYTFKAVDTSSNSAETNFTIQPALSISSPRGTVGQLITFTGAGFASGKTADVNWTPSGTTVVACHSTVSTSGTFTCTYAIPAIVTGSYTFTASTGSSASASAPFEVIPSLAVAPAAGPVGTAVVFVGRGYAFDSLVAVTWAVGTACSGTVGTNGTFTCGYTIPAVGAGVHEFTGTYSSLSATTNFTVRSVLTLTPSTGGVGTAVTVSGTGFAASAEVTVSSLLGTACSVPASSSGAFSCPYLVPAAPTAVYEFSASVGGTSVANANFTLTPSLTVNPSSGPVSTKATFSATGFAASSSIAVVSTTYGTVCSSTTAPNGSYSCSFTFTIAPAGSYAFKATDGSGNSASATFILGTTLTVSPAIGVVGSAIEFNGTAFAASTPYTVSWSGGTVCSGTTGPAGGFTCNATMPAAPLGTQKFTATAGPSASTSFTVQPSLLATPGSGGAGTTVTFTGAGYPTSVWVNVTWSGSTYCNTTTGSNGGFSCSLTIPAGTAGGSYSFTGTDQLKDKASATFLVVTGLLDSPNHGPAGTPVVLTGSNFAPEVAVAVTWNSTPICPSATTNASGGFSCDYTIPTGTPGGSTVFSATASGATASVQFIVTYLGSVPTGLTLGGNVSLAGGGYAPNTAFTITAPWGTACGGTSSATGMIGCTATVPMSATPGTYNFTGRTGSDTANSSFGLFSLSLPSASLTSVDVGQSVTFSVVASGGSGVLTYRWSGLPSGCPTTGEPVVCSPTAPLSAGPITVQVFDPVGFNVTSKALVYTVFAAPVQAVPTPTRSGADLGQTVNFTASVQYGSGGGGYVWSTTGLGCTGTTTATIDCAPPTAGSFTVSYQYTDSNGVAATGSTDLTFVVSTDPTQSTPAPQPASVDVGQTVVFSAQVAGGSGGGSYVWTPSSSDLGCAATTGAKLTCKPTAAGSYSVSSAWTDSNGVAATGTAELTGFTVYVDPTVSVPTTSPSSVTYVYVGQTVTFVTSAPVEGSGGVTFTWTAAAGLGCPSSTIHTDSIACVPIASGSYPVSVTATDSNGFTTAPATLATPMPVYSVPAVTPIVLSRPALDEGQAITLSTTASGGDGTLKYVWSTSGLTGCSSAAATIMCTAGTSPNTYTITVYVTDVNSVASATASVNLTISPKPALTAPTASPSHTVGGYPSGDVGQTYTFTTTPTGGPGTFVYTWSVSSGLGCTVDDAPTITCVLATVGNWSVSVSAMDGNGVMTGTESLARFDVLAAPTIAAVTVLRGTSAVTSADTHQTITFGTTVTGGAAPTTTAGYTYVWTVDGTTVTSTAGTALNCTYKAPTSGLSAASSITCVLNQAGAFYVNVSAVDWIGGATTVVSSGAFVVFPAPTVVLTVTPSTVLAGKSVTFTAVVTNGTGKYTAYSWSSLPTGCTSTKGPTLTCTVSVVATSSVTLTVTDSNGANGSGTTNLTVQASFLGLPATEGYEIVAGVIVAGIAALAVGLVLLTRRRRGRHQQLQF